MRCCLRCYSALQRTLRPFANTGFLAPPPSESDGCWGVGRNRGGDRRAGLTLGSELLQWLWAVALRPRCCCAPLFGQCRSPASKESYGERTEALALGWWYCMSPKNSRPVPSPRKAHPLDDSNNPPIQTALLWQGATPSDHVGSAPVTGECIRPIQRDG